MKKNIKVLVFVLLFINVFACNNANNEVLKFEDYDSTILIAEKQLLSNEYISASTYFNNAYSIRKNMLAFDMNNALILAVKLKDWNQALVWSKRLVKKGVGMPYFEKKIFSAFHQTEEWRNFVKDFDKDAKYFEKYLKKEMVDSLEILMDIDQQAYCLLPSKKIDLSNVFDKTVFLDSLLFRLIKNNGFPNEEKVGAFIYNDTLISPLTKFYALYRHSYQANSDLVNEFLITAVGKGELKKAVYENTLIGDNMDFAVIDCKIYTSSLLKESSRNNFFKEKLVFQNSKQNDFNFYVPLSKFSFKTSSDKNSMMSTFNYLCDYKRCENKN